MIKGISKDEPIVENSNGGKQSKSEYAMHLVDANFLKNYLDEENEFLNCITDYMNTLNKEYIINAFEELAEIQLNLHYTEAILKVAEVLKQGAERYEANNWRLIPSEEHLNHALIHYFAYIQDDTQDDHLEHCLCRLMMTYATEESEKFNYGAYIR